MGCCFVMNTLKGVEILYIPERQMHCLRANNIPRLYDTTDPSAFLFDGSSLGTREYRLHGVSLNCNIDMLPPRL